jgi:hypothetical protein
MDYMLQTKQLIKKITIYFANNILDGEYTLEGKQLCSPDSKYYNFEMINGGVRFYIDDNTEVLVPYSSIRNIVFEYKDSS